MYVAMKYRARRRVQYAEIDRDFYRDGMRGKEKNR